MYNKRLIAVVLVFLMAAAQAEPSRQALVIGNAAYENESELVNTLNDARDVAAMLNEKLGFAVTKVENVNRTQLAKAIYSFVKKVQKLDGTALIYYSGHGIQGPNNKNYLLPVNAKISDEMDIGVEGLALDEMLSGLNQRSERAVNLVILDACRNNPFHY